MHPFPPPLPQQSQRTTRHKHEFDAYKSHPPQSVEFKAAEILVALLHPVAPDSAPPAFAVKILQDIKGEGRETKPPLAGAVPRDGLERDASQALTVARGASPPDGGDQGRADVALGPMAKDPRMIDLSLDAMQSQMSPPPKVQGAVRQRIGVSPGSAPALPDPRVTGVAEWRIDTSFAGAGASNSPVPRDADEEAGQSWGPHRLPSSLDTPVPTKVSAVGNAHARVPDTSANWHSGRSACKDGAVESAPTSRP